MTVMVLKLQRIALLLLLQLAFLALGASVSILPFAAKERRLRIASRCMRWWARIGCLLLGIRVTATGAFDRDAVYFLASNHCSYLDILVIGSIMPAVFVSKSEVGSWPVAGWLARLAGTVFVERQSKASSLPAIGEVKSRIASGVSVIIFPEGTTNNGKTIREFKSTFFHVPAEMPVPVLPVSLLYARINGQPVTAEAKDPIAWYGEMPLLPHFWNLVGIRSIDARVHFSPPLSPRIRASSFQERKELASRAEAAVRAGHLLLRDSA